MKRRKKKGKNQDK